MLCSRLPSGFNRPICGFNGKSLLNQRGERSKVPPKNTPGHTCHMSCCLCCCLGNMTNSRCWKVTRYIDLKLTSKARTDNLVAGRLLKQMFRFCC